ncbi:Isoquinoline 1-oxidoreductase subunit [Caulobacter segnis]|uniref:Isoquinoline 1-oxidoreductase subunit n=1 Tax=Caulobacter segnis TaxID=88688 RepID=UPI0024106E96|nr:Isoquinoline 1-oxidoreductase subunit [Caulobacter segnis]MDG2520004.1 Isoquinoline 1-oxidoreductase subunit [Caulobacter segnis]
MRAHTLLMITGGVALAGAVALSTVQAAAPRTAAAPQGLQPVSAFASIADTKARSQALFVEAGKVIQHPRCLNCHPADRTPTQGMKMIPHNPPMQGGQSGHGVPGLPCLSCHHEKNVPAMGDRIRSVPGDPKWALAPIEMAWQGRSLGQICTQIQDPARNGGKTLAELHHHMAEDHLVGWGWNPGAGREPAPGDQKRFGELIKAWIDTGAACPA